MKIHSNSLQKKVLRIEIVDKCNNNNHNKVINKHRMKEVAWCLLFRTMY